MHMAAGFSSQALFDTDIDFLFSALHIGTHGIPINFFFSFQIILYNGKLKASYFITNDKHIILFDVKNQKDN